MRQETNVFRRTLEDEWKDEIKFAMKGLWKPQQSPVILGEIAKDNYWEATIELASQSVKVDINVPDGELDPEQLDYIRTVVTRANMRPNDSRLHRKRNYAT